jgi:hypothetical protein
MVGSDKQVFRLHNLPETIGQIFFQTAQNFCRQIKTLFNIYKAPVNIEQNKNSQNAKKFQAPGFFRVPNFLGRNEKKSTFTTFQAG